MSLPLPPSRIKAIVFDAYGTLFDVYSISTAAEYLFPGKGSQIVTLWRERQIEYSRLRSLSNQYVDFWHCTEDALRFVNKAMELDMTDKQFAYLMDQYLHVQAFEENANTLQALAEQGFTLCILSNGTPRMLQAACSSARLSKYFTHVLSVDSVKCFKTASAAYTLAAQSLGVVASEILFVSSNAWDVAGAAWHGYPTFWCNRTGAPMEELGITPDFEGRTLRELLHTLSAYTASSMQRMLV